MLGPHVPELRSLELLLLVARTQSLSAAAAQLGISQQAASSRMRTMEALIGTSLLSRSTRGSALTETGELIVQWSSRVLDAAELLDAGITALRADTRAHLSIAASQTAFATLEAWGALGALRSCSSDPTLARALRRLHEDVAHRWTVEELGRVAGGVRRALPPEGGDAADGVPPGVAPRDCRGRSRANAR